jgi:hypothetical protein
MNADEERCSFCGKWKKQTRALIAGPGVYICNECIAECAAVIERLETDELRQSARWFAPWRALRQGGAIITRSAWRATRSIPRTLNRARPYSFLSRPNSRSTEGPALKERQTSSRAASASGGAFGPRRTV